jgi:hypothetical protein
MKEVLLSQMERGKVYIGINGSRYTFLHSNGFTRLGHQIYTFDNSEGLTLGFTEYMGYKFYDEKKPFKFGE